MGEKYNKILCTPKNPVEMIIPFETELPCNPKLLKPHGEVGWWKSSHRQFYNGSAEAVHGQIQKELLFGGYLGGRKELAAFICCCRFVVLQNSQSELLPTSVPPDPALGAAPGSIQVKSTRGALLPTFPLWDEATRWVQHGAFLRGTCREARRKTKN